MVTLPPLISDILAISLDGPASPSIHLNLPQRPAGKHANGWGFGWYPDDHSSALVTKDPVASGEQVLIDAITDWSNFRSTIFFCKVRGASKGYNHTQTQPFSRSFAGRDWLFMHNGDLDKNALEQLQDRSKEAWVLEPLGSTDSELAFCTLLSLLQQHRIRKLANMEPALLHQWFLRFDALGSSDMYLSDGSSIVCFHGTQSPKPMYYARIQPPNNQDTYACEAASISLSDPRDAYRTVMIVSSSLFAGGQWQQMCPGQMIVIRRGALVWNSAPEHHQPVDQSPQSEPEPPQTAAPETPVYESKPRTEQACVLEETAPQQQVPLAPDMQTDRPHAVAEPVPPVSTPNYASVPVDAVQGSVYEQALQDSMSAAAQCSAQTDALQALVYTQSEQPPAGDGLQSPEQVAALLEPVLVPEPESAAEPEVPEPVQETVLNVRAITQTVDGEPLNYRVYEVTHETHYEYTEPVEHSTHTFRLQPTDDLTQEVEFAKLTISCAAEEIVYEDVFGNQSIHCVINEPYTKLSLAATSRVKVFAVPPDDHGLSRRQTSIPLVWMPWQRQMMMPYLLPSELPESQLMELTEYAMSFVERNDYHLMKTIEDINLSIYRDYKYVSGSTSLSTTPFDVYTSRQGVCQDFANLFICLARLLSIPARYRMGYIYTGANYANKIQSEASHAWAEVYLPYVGWRGFDPTNGCVAGQDHVRVACGRNYRDATPTSGTIYKGGGVETLTVDVKMHQMHD